jgi:hypothetical protein
MTIGSGSAETIFGRSAAATQRAFAAAISGRRWWARRKTLEASSGEGNGSSAATALGDASQQAHERSRE